MKFWNFLEEYEYKGFDIDEGIPSEIIDKLNKIKHIEICSTCSGHPKGTGINFVLKKYKNKTINELKDYLNELIKKITIENTNVSWSVWIEPGAMLYNSRNGYNDKVLKLFNNSKKLANDTIPYRIMIHIEYIDGINGEDFDLWWREITTNLQKINF